MYIDPEDFMTTWKDLINTKMTWTHEEPLWSHEKPSIDNPIPVRITIGPCQLNIDVYFGYNNRAQTTEWTFNLPIIIDDDTRKDQDLLTRAITLLTLDFRKSYLVNDFTTLKTLRYWRKYPSQVCVSFPDLICHPTFNYGTALLTPNYVRTLRACYDYIESIDEVGSRLKQFSQDAGLQISNGTDQFIDILKCSQRLTAELEPFIIRHLLNRIEPSLRQE